MNIQKLISDNKNFIFLDSNFSKNRKSYFFCEPIHTIQIFDFFEIENAFNLLNKYSKKYWTAGYLRYESFFAKRSDKPLLYFGVYENPIVCEDVFFDELCPPFLELKPDLSFAEFNKAVEKIKAEIRKGNTYQVNFTFDNFVESQSSAENIYFYLRDKQKTDYSAFIKNDFDQIMSFSPELFFEINEDNIFAKPMKGTSSLSDKNFLLNNEKIRAENLMIVDLLRNDLGRVADNSSVKVESLLDIEEYETLYQLTSTISAKISEIDYSKIFTALFPCGSVTGVPKIETMRVIGDLEKGERGVYCGAIGYTSPDKRAVFSVPIRILQDHNKNVWKYRVGSGIVWDSDAKEEWEENQSKMLFLQNENFNLIETMLFDNEKIVYLDEHLARLKKSVEFFKFVYDEKSLRKELKKIKEKTKKIARLELTRYGKFELQILPLKEIKNKKVEISDLKLDKNNVFLRHKTTKRDWYENVFYDIIYDKIFLNQEDELCEGSRTNIFLEIDGKLYTPHSSSGLLCGILRNDLIKKGKATEKVLYLDDLKKAEKIYLGNSVRGLVGIQIEKFAVEGANNVFA